MIPSERISLQLSLTNQIHQCRKLWFNTASWKEALLARCLMSDAEWAIFKPFLTENRARWAATT
jgi:hypothetical protein